MFKTSFSATTTPSAVFAAPLSGEGTLAVVAASVIADGIKLQGANQESPTAWNDLTDVTVTTAPGNVNFLTDFRYLRIAPITGAVTAAEVECSGSAL